MSKPLRNILLAGVAAVAAVGGVMLSAKPELAKVHEEIERDYDNVEHIDANTFSQLNARDVVLFDVRDPEEYAVSHLRGAVRVDPNISEAEFQTLYADLLAGKKAVFYCSVGRRSSDLAERVAHIVEQSTESAPINLIGGIFQWSNEKRTLMGPNGYETDAVHPYNDYWGRLIENPDVIRYFPLENLNGEAAEPFE